MDNAILKGKLTLFLQKAYNNSISKGDFVKLWLAITAFP